jgi:hypothetical protein
MPNWCQNVATISHEDKEKIDAIEHELNKEKEDIGLFQMLRPRPADQEENWYEWNISNWGTKWDINYCDFERIDDNTIKLIFDTAWGPCITLYEYMETEGYSIEGFYNEEGMAFCGCFRDGYDDNYNYSDYCTSSGVRDNVPSDIDEMFAISDRLEDNESEEEDDEIVWSDDEDEVEEPEYEMTEWFDVKTKPVHLGLYEVEYDKPNAWPFPSRLEWTGKKWINGQGEVRKDVGRWRGITQNEHNMFVELEKLKVEFDQLMSEQDS